MFVNEVFIYFFNAINNDLIIYYNVKENIILHLSLKARARLRFSIETLFNII